MVDANNAIHSKKQHSKYERDKQLAKELGAEVTKGKSPSYGFKTKVNSKLGHENKCGKRNVNQKLSKLLPQSRGKPEPRTFWSQLNLLSFELCFVSLVSFTGFSFLVC